MKGQWTYGPTVLPWTIHSIHLMPVNTANEDFKEYNYITGAVEKHNVGRSVSPNQIGQGLNSLWTPPPPLDYFCSSRSSKTEDMN